MNFTVSSGSTGLAKLSESVIGSATTPGKKKTKYAYYLSDGVSRFYNSVARAVWKSAKYTKKFCERELELFHKEIEQEWLGKINYLLREIGEE